MTLQQAVYNFRDSVQWTKSKRYCYHQARIYRWYLADPQSRPFTGPLKPLP